MEPPVRPYIANLPVRVVVWLMVLTAIAVGFGIRDGLLTGFGYGAMFVLGSLMAQRAEARWPGRGGMLFQLTAVATAVVILLLASLFQIPL